MILCHATCVELDGVGVLLRGPSGAGKSDLAILLIDQGAHLVADDQVRLWAEDGVLTAAAPERLAGLVEARGIGIVRLDHLPVCRVGLVVDLVPPEAVERLPETSRQTVAGIELPALSLAPFEASAPAKLRLALRAGRVDSLLDRPARAAAAAGAKRLA